MKMKKALIAGIALTAAVMLAACGASNGVSKEATTGAGHEAATSAVSGKTGEAAAEDWYKTVLEDEAVQKEYSYYRLQDIDLDGVDELFLSTTAEHFIGAEDRACLMANVNGEAKVLQEIGGNAGEYWIYNQSDATLSYFYRSSGEEHIVLYQLKDGKLKEISSADSYDPHHYTEADNKETVYLLDKDEVSEKEFQGYWEQYGNEAGALTFDPIADISIDYGKSDIYSQEDMDAAIKLIKEEFAGWKGCELHNIRYTSDDCNSEENIKWANSLADGKKYTQCIQFQTDFHSPVKDEDLEGKAWDPDTEYKDYTWSLAREDGGNWELINWGY